MSVTAILLRICLIAIVGHLLLLFIEHVGLVCFLLNNLQSLF